MSTLTRFSCRGCRETYMVATIRPNDSHVIAGFSCPCGTRTPRLWRLRLAARMRRWLGVAVVALVASMLLTPTPTAHAAPEDGYYITRAEYDAVKVGMRLKKVRHIVGAKGHTWTDRRYLGLSWTVAPSTAGYFVHGRFNKKTKRLWRWTWCEYGGCTNASGGS